MESLSADPIVKRSRMISPQRDNCGGHRQTEQAEKEPDNRLSPVEMAGQGVQIAHFVFLAICFLKSGRNSASM